MEKIETKNPYLRINLNYLTMPGTYYVISEIDPTTSMVIGTSDTVPILENPGNNPWIDTYYKVCNGTSYAYQLVMMQELYNPGGGSYSITQPAKLSAREACEVCDYEQGIVIPFYQAIDQSQWNQIPDGIGGHPYKINLGNNPENPLYDKIQILNGTAGTIGGPYIDAQGNHVLNGMLVEKKLDQFKHFEYDQTTTFNPSSTFTSNTFENWNTMFNNLYNSSINGQPEAYYHWPLTNELVCNVQQGNSGGGSVGNGNDNGWGQVLDDYISCFGSQQNISSLLDCLEDVDTQVGGLIFSPVNGVGEEILFEYNSTLRKFVISDPSIDLEYLPTGLYFLTSFINGGKVFKTVFEHNNDEDQREHKDFVQMTISPNPIENDMLVAKLQTSKTMNVRVKVYTLNGEIIANEVVSLTQGTVFTYQKSISGYATPYNQIRVQLIFEDDSSTIQQTGIR